MKKLIGLLMVCLSLGGCEKAEPIKVTAEPAVDIRKIAEQAVDEIGREEYWRRSEKDARDKLQEVSNPGAVALAQVDLEKIMADRKEEANGKADAVSKLEEITQKKPPYWPAIERYKEAIRNADEVEYSGLRMITLDQVLAKFGTMP